MDLTYDPALLERVSYLEKRYFNAALLAIIRTQYKATSDIRRLPLRLNSALGKVYGGAASLREEWKKERLARGEQLSVEELARMEGSLTGYLAGGNKNFDFTLPLDSKRRELHVAEEWAHLFESHYLPAFRKTSKLASGGAVKKEAIRKTLFDALNELSPVSDAESAVLSDIASVLADALK